jgi:single-stranded DNA-binding protein
METQHKHKNEVHLAGTLVKVPEVRYTTSGKAVATLTVVTKYQDKSQFHRVVCWEMAAEKAAPLKVGEFV